MFLWHRFFGNTVRLISGIFEPHSPQAALTKKSQISWVVAVVSKKNYAERRDFVSLQTRKTLFLHTACVCVLIQCVTHYDANYQYSTLIGQQGKFYWFQLTDLDKKRDYHFQLFRLMNNYGERVRDHFRFGQVPTMLNYLLALRSRQISISTVKLSLSYRKTG